MHMAERHSSKQLTLQDRLKAWADKTREQADKLKPGPARDALLRKSSRRKKRPSMMHGPGRLDCSRRRWRRLWWPILRRRIWLWWSQRNVRLRRRCLVNQKVRSDAGSFHSNCALVPTAAGAFNGTNILRSPKAAAQRFKVTAVISMMMRCEWGDASCASLIILSPPSNCKHHTRGTIASSPSCPV